MNFFRQVQRALVPLACAVAAVPAMATDVTVGINWNDGYGTANTTLNGATSTGTAQIPFSLTYGGQTFEAFCMELDQAAMVGTVNYTVSSYVNDGFSRLFAAAGFNGSSSGTDAVVTRDQKSALQLAVWEVLYDGLLLSGGKAKAEAEASASPLFSGNFMASNFSSASVRSLAEGYLTAAGALQANQYTTTTLYRYSSGQSQDFVTTQGYASVSGVSAVPEPETAFLWLGGLAGLVALRRRQRRA